MAARRHKITSIVARERSQGKEKHEENLRYLSGKDWLGDPTNKRNVARAASEYRARDTVEKRYSRKISSTEARLLKHHGFDVVGKNLILDNPRKRPTNGRPQLKARIKIGTEGTVKFTSKQRRDYIVGFTKKERENYAKTPSTMIDDLLVRLKKKHREIRGKRKIQARLQWGAFESRKDFSPTLFTKFIDTARKVAAMLKRKYGPKIKTPLDNLTGVHFVIHVQKRSKRKSRKKRKSKRK